MSNWLRYLLLSVSYLLIAGCSSSHRTVLVTPPTPLACRVLCNPYPTAPPASSLELDDWLMWGDDVSADYEECRRLHEDCVKGSAE